MECYMYGIWEVQGFLFLFSDKRYTGLVSSSGSSQYGYRERQREMQREAEQELARGIWKLVGLRHH